MARNKPNTAPATDATISPEQLEAERLTREQVAAETAELSPEEFAVQFPELHARITEAAQVAEVQQIRQEARAEVAMLSVEAFAGQFGELHARIAEAARPALPPQPDLNVKGFLLEVDDPFAEGTLRTFGKLTGVKGLRLPYVLPKKSAATPKALLNYIVRAGGTDAKRADRAKAAFEKLTGTTSGEAMKLPKKKSPKK
jgi:hypothetical protein